MQIQDAGCCIARAGPGYRLFPCIVRYNRVGNVDGVWGVTEQKVHLSPAPSRNPYSAFGLFRTLAVHSQHVQPHFGWGAFYLHVVNHGLGVVGDRTSVNELLARLNPT